MLIYLVLKVLEIYQTVKCKVQTKKKQIDMRPIIILIDIRENKIGVAPKKRKIVIKSSCQRICL